MAGLGWKAWTRERLSQPDLQGFIQDQVVMAFTTAVDRGIKLTAPAEGMTCKLMDLDVIEDYVNGAWRRRLDGATAPLTAGNRAATNNYDLASLTISPGRPYRCIVRGAAKLTTSLNAKGTLRLYDGAAVQCEDQVEVGAARDVSGFVERGFVALDGAARTVKLNLEVTAGSITTYADSANSFLQYEWFAL